MLVCPIAARQDRRGLKDVGEVAKSCLEKTGHEKVRYQRFYALLLLYDHNISRFYDDIDRVAHGKP